MSIRYLTLDEIIYIHEDQINRYGGIHGIRDRNLIYIDRDSFNDSISLDRKIKILLSASRQLYYIGRNHAFLDGNKRTALVSALTAMYLNGFKLTLKHDHLYELTVDAAQDKINIPGIAEIFNNYMEGLNEDITKKSTDN